MATQIQLRRGTAAEWTSANPVLAEGELGLELDTGNFKIGNGVNNWSALDYGFASLPAGGNTGQILAKDSNTDYDFIWIDNYTEELSLTVRNTTGVTLTKGQIVYVNGASGGKITVALAQANSESTSAGTIGMIKADIANNAEGSVILNGTISGLNTNGLSGGQPLYLSPTVAGGWTSTRPTGNDHLIVIGFVENVNAATGSIFVKVTNYPEIDELTGTLIDSTPDDGDVLTYEASTDLWKNKPIPLPVVAVSDLTDVDLTGLDDDYILRYDAASSTWKVEVLPTGVQDLDDLTDVDLTTPPTDGQVLTFNNTTSQWEAATPTSGGATELDDLTDVDLTTVAPVLNDVLTFDGTNWVAEAPTSSVSYPTVQTVTYTTSSIADGVSVTGTVTIEQGYRILKYETSAAARVRLYVTTTGRDNDSARDFGIDPDANIGLILDVKTTASELSNYTSPQADGYIPSGTAIPIRVDNVSGTTQAITVTLTYVRTI